MNAHIDGDAKSPRVEKVHPCASCGLELPITVCPDHAEAVSVSCAGCGARYRGIIDTDNTDLPLNIQVLKG